jgi:hypothetical protein
MFHLFSALVFLLNLAPTPSQRHAAGGNARGRRQNVGAGDALLHHDLPGDYRPSMLCAVLKCIGYDGALISVFLFLKLSHPSYAKHLVTVTALCISCVIVMIAIALISVALSANTPGLRRARAQDEFRQLREGPRVL